MSKVSPLVSIQFLVNLISPLGKEWLSEEGQEDQVIELKISKIKIVWKQHKTLRSFTGSLLSRQGRFYCGKHWSLGLEPLTERSLCKYLGPKSKQTVCVLRAFCVGVPVSLLVSLPRVNSVPRGSWSQGSSILSPSGHSRLPWTPGPFLPLLYHSTRHYILQLLLALPGSGSCSFTACKMFWSRVLSPPSPHTCGVTFISVLHIARPPGQHAFLSAPQLVLL